MPWFEPAVAILEIASLAICLPSANSHLEVPTEESLISYSLVAFIMSAEPPLLIYVLLFRLLSLIMSPFSPSGTHFLSRSGYILL